VAGADLDLEGVAATGPHCGVCEHVTFGDDWERTPRCTKWDEVTSIDVHSVCEAFECRSPHHESD
jgi:hypothetical protein